MNQETSLIMCPMIEVADGLEMPWPATKFRLSPTFSHLFPIMAGKFSGPVQRYLQQKGMIAASEHGKSSTRTGLEPAIFANHHLPESNALPLGHQAHGTKL